MLLLSSLNKAMFVAGHPPSAFESPVGKLKARDFPSGDHDTSPNGSLNFSSNLEKEANLMFCELKGLEVSVDTVGSGVGLLQTGREPVSDVGKGVTIDDSAVAVGGGILGVRVGCGVEEVSAVTIDDAVDLADRLATKLAKIAVAINKASQTIWPSRWIGSLSFIRVIPFA